MDKDWKDWKIQYIDKNDEYQVDKYRDIFDEIYKELETLLKTVSIEDILSKLSENEIQQYLRKLKLQRIEENK